MTPDEISAAHQEQDSRLAIPFNYTREEIETSLCELVEAGLLKVAGRGGRPSRHDTRHLLGAGCAPLPPGAGSGGPRPDYTGDQHEAPAPSPTSYLMARRRSLTACSSSRSPSLRRSSKRH